jgi:beta-phosphoglucomutase-like phosphatase (HAD superfamily)
MPPQESDTTDTVHRVKGQLDKLTERQSAALKRAIYLGMTTDEAKKYDERQRQITELVQELNLLEKEARKVARKIEPKSVLMEEYQSLLRSLQNETIAIARATSLLTVELQRITGSTGHLTKGHVTKGHVIPFPKNPS